MGKKKLAAWLYYAIEDLGQDFAVIFETECAILIEIFEWYLKRYPLEDDNPEIIEMYSALLKYKDTNKDIYLARDGEDIILRQIIREYLNGQTED